MNQGPTYSHKAHFGLRRHLAGWPLAALSVALPLLAVCLFVPRPAEPDQVPLPLPDRRNLKRERLADAQLAAAVRAQPLPFVVRSVGEWMRRHGAALAQGDHAAAELARIELTRNTRELLSARAQPGQAELLRLRSIQTELFMAAVERWRGRVERRPESGGSGQSKVRPGPGVAVPLAGADLDLVELGGDFVASCRSNGWLDERGRPWLSPEQLFVLYRVHWTQVAGLMGTSAFRPRLDEMRLYYRLLMEAPGGDNPGLADARRLELTQVLGRLDPDYPAELARGVLLLRLNRPEAALQVLQAFLKQRPDGPWVLRARNHALAALARIPEEE